MFSGNKGKTRLIPGFVLTFLLFCCPAPPSEGSETSETLEVGVAWEGVSSMPERVLAGMRKTLADTAPQIHLDVRKTLPGLDALDAVVTEFENTKSAMVILRSSGASLLSRREVRIPAFIGAANDPVALGAVKDPLHPGPRITGVTYSLPVRMKLEAFRQVWPRMKTYLLLVEAGHPGSPIDARQTETAAAALGLSGRTLFCASLEEALRAVREAGPDEIILLGIQALLMDNVREILRAAGKNHPVFSYSEQAVLHGALAGVVADDYKLGKMLGDMLIAHLIHHKPIRDLPVRHDPDPRLRLNHSTLERFRDGVPFAILSLAKSEEILESIYRSAPSGIGMVENRVLTRVNDYILELTGYRSEELLGQSARILYPTEEEFAYVGREKYRQIHEKGTGSVQTRWRTKDGHIRHIILSSTPLDPQDLSRGVTFTALDITRRVEATQTLARRTFWFIAGLGGAVFVLMLLVVWLVASLGQRRTAMRDLARSEARFRSLMDEVSPVAVQGYAPDGTVQYWNKASERLYGFTAEEAVGRNLVELIIPPEMVAGVREAMRRMAETGEPIPASELELMHKDGRRVPVFSSHTLVQVEGRGRELFCLDVDLSARKRDEEEREKLRIQLAQAQKMESIGRLAGGVAHDFNNMLSVILGHAELAMTGLAPPDPLHEDLASIRKAAEHSAELTRQLLAFARRQTVAPQVLDLNACVEKTLEMLRRLIGEAITLQWRPGDSPVRVHMDPTQIEQILTNLCINARDAIPDTGRIVLETGISDLRATRGPSQLMECLPGRYALIVVSDSGCGMDRETLVHLFEPFVTTKEQGRGTGLGMATVYGIVKQNRGFIHVYSEPGQGSTFRIYLPCHEDGGTPLPRPEPPKATPGSETLLLVEDEPMILNMTRTMLEKRGYTVLAAAGPMEAMALAQAHAAPIHLLVTDVVMPEMNGRALADRLQARFPDLKTLFMSGYTANVIAHHGVLDEGVFFIQKPFTMEDLALQVRKALAGPGT